MNCYLQNNKHYYASNCVVTTPESTSFEFAPSTKVLDVSSNSGSAVDVNKNNKAITWSKNNLSANTETYMRYTRVQKFTRCYTIFFSAVFTRSNYADITSNDSVTFTFKNGDDVIDTLSYKLYPQYMNTYQIMHRLYNISKDVRIFVTSTVDITLLNDGYMYIYWEYY